MKFLLFNAAVAAAIVYLLAVDDGDTPVSTLPAASQAEWQQKFDRIKDRVAALKSEAEPQEAVLPIPELAKGDSPISAEKIDKPEQSPLEKAPTQTPPPLEAEREVEVLTQPEALRPAPITGDVVKPGPATPKNMTPRQRRRELNRLVHDMEMMFADKLAQ